MEGSFEHVGFRKVATLGAELSGGSDAETPAVSDVE